MMKQEQILNELNYALENTNSQIRVSLLTEIAHYLPQSLRAEVQSLQVDCLRKALVPIKAMRYEGDRLDALKHLIGQLPPDVEAPSEAIAITKALPSGISRVEALTVLAPHLPSNLLLEALDIARAFRKPNGEYCLALSLTAIAPQLPEPLREEATLEALAAADSLPSEIFRDDVYRSNALIAVADILPEALRADVLQKALESASAIEEEWCRAMNLARLAPKLPETLQTEVFQEALDAAENEVEDWATSSALMVLAPELPPDLLPEAANLARDLRSGRHLSNINRLKVLIATTAKLPERLPEVFATVKKIRSEDERAEALAAIAPHLPSELLPAAFDLAKDIRAKKNRLPALIALSSPISKLPEEELLPLWQTIEHLLSQLSRREFAHHMLALAAVIYRIGGEEAVAEALEQHQWR